MPLEPKTVMIGLRVTAAAAEKYRECSHKKGLYLAEWLREAAERAARDPEPKP